MDKPNDEYTTELYTSHLVKTTAACGGWYLVEANFVSKSAYKKTYFRKVR